MIAILWSWAVTPAGSHPLPSAVYALYHMDSSLLYQPSLFGCSKKCQTDHDINSMVTLQVTLQVKCPGCQCYKSGCIPVRTGHGGWYYILNQGLEYVCEYIMMIDCHLMEALVHISLAVCLINCYGAGGVRLHTDESIAHASIWAYGHYTCQYEHVGALRIQNCKCLTALHVWIRLAVSIGVCTLSTACDTLGCLEMGWKFCICSGA